MKRVFITPAGYKRCFPSRVGCKVEGNGSLRFWLPQIHSRRGELFLFAVNCFGTKFAYQCISLLMMRPERWWILSLCFLIHSKITCHYCSTKTSGDEEGSSIRKWISDGKRLSMEILRNFAFPSHDTSSMQFADEFFFCLSFWRVTFCSAWLTNEVSLKGFPPSFTRISLESSFSNVIQFVHRWFRAFQTVHGLSARKL